MRVLRIVGVAVCYLAFLGASWQMVVGLKSGDIFGFRYRAHEVDVWFFMFVVLLTLLGVVLGTLYEFLIGRADHDVAWWTVMREALSSVRFGVALLISPLIAFYVFDQVYTREHNFSVYVFCFQNGFFWKATLGALKGTRSHRTVDASSAAKEPEGEIVNAGPE